MTKTSPLTAVTWAVVPATTGASPAAEVARVADSVCVRVGLSRLATSGQLSLASATPSASVSLGAAGAAVVGAGGEAAAA